MKTKFAIAITISGLTIKEAFDKPEPICNLDNLDFKLEHEVDMQPEEYTTAVNSLGKLFSTMIYDLAKPSHMVKEKPADDKPFLCVKCNSRPCSGGNSVLCSECQDKAPVQEFRCPGCSCQFEVDPIYGTRVVRD